MVDVASIPAIELAESERVARLEPPEGQVEMVLDTDTFNEIDDQFAVVYAVIAPSLDVHAMYAAPFHNTKSHGPGDGMERSYEELRNVLELIDHPDPAGIAYRGAQSYLDDQSSPAAPPAVTDLIERARARDPNDPLYVVAIGAPTNVAMAVHRAPDIGDRIVVVWLGGHPLDWHTAREFNLQQDYIASRTLFDAGVPLVQIPCRNVAEHVRSSVPELETHLEETGAIGEYLLDIVSNYHTRPSPDRPWSKEIWDLAPIAYLRNPEWIPSVLVSSPILSAELTYSKDTARHLIRVGRYADRDAIFADFFDHLADHGE